MLKSKTKKTKSPNSIQKIQKQYAQNKRVMDTRKGDSVSQPPSSTYSFTKTFPSFLEINNSEILSCTKTRKEDAWFSFFSLSRLNTIILFSSNNLICRSDYKEDGQVCGFVTSQYYLVCSEQSSTRDLNTKGNFSSTVSTGESLIKG